MQWRPRRPHIYCYAHIRAAPWIPFSHFAEFRGELRFRVFQHNRPKVVNNQFPQYSDYQHIDKPERVRRRRNIALIIACVLPLRKSWRPKQRNPG